MRKLLTANKYLPVALAWAAFAAIGAPPALAQSSGTWGAAISTRNSRPYMQTPPANSALLNGGGSTGYDRNLHDDRW